MKKLFVGIILLGLGNLPLCAQKMVGGQTAEEKKNLEIAILERKDMLQYGHFELAEKVHSAGRIQHNPNIPSGRDAYRDYMIRIRHVQNPQFKPEPIQKEWKRPPTLIISAGPYVWFMTGSQAKDPVDPTKEYTRFGFDVVRLENGLIVEHWDAQKKNAPAANGQ